MERLGIASRKLEAPTEHFMQRWQNKGQRWYRPNRSRRDGRNTRKKHTKKDLRGPDNHDGVTTHLEPDVLERKVKWALGSITTNKAGEGDGIPAEIFSNPKR